MTTALLGFALAATVLILAPGPDSMLVMRNSFRGGRRVGLCTSRIGYDLLRFVGAAYLIWLGVTSLWPRYRRGGQLGGAQVGEADGAADVPGEAGEAGEAAGAGDVPELGRGPTVSLPRAYVNGVISNLCNPKIGAFFVAFLPGFIPAGTSVSEFSLLLGVWFAVETGVWLGTLVWMIDRGAGWLSRSKIQRRLEKMTGIVLIGFGIKLATETR